MHDYVQVPVTLQEHQFHKLRRGHKVQLQPHQFGSGMRHPHSIVVHHETAKKMHAAGRLRKGVRIGMSQHEMDMSGEGLGDFFNKLKQGAQWVKQKIIDNPFYQQNIRPLAKQAVQKGFELAQPHLGALAPAAKAGLDQLGERTGAFGLRQHARRLRAGNVRGRGKAQSHGYIPNQFGHGTGGEDVSMSSRELMELLPASEFEPIVKPSKHPSVIQYQEAMPLPRKRRVKRNVAKKYRKPGEYGGSFRMS